MRHRFAVLCLFLPLASARPAHSQTTDPSVFLEQAQTASLSGKSVSTIKMTGTANWVAGSLHESGTAQLSASADGSSSLQLSLAQASRTETQTASDLDKTCQRTDAAGKVYEVAGPNCFVAINWFAPSLFTQPLSRLSSLLATTDDGLVTKDGTSLHQMSYRLTGLQGKDAAASKRMQDASAVKVLFDPQTSLPSRLEYKVYADNNVFQSFDVKVLFSDYRSVDGAMLPFHIERYIQRTLQLTLDISNATIE